MSSTDNPAQRAPNPFADALCLLDGIEFDTGDFRGVAPLKLIDDLLAVGAPAETMAELKGFVEAGGIGAPAVAEVVRALAIMWDDDVKDDDKDDDKGDDADDADDNVDPTQSQERPNEYVVVNVDDSEDGSPLTFRLGGDAGVSPHESQTSDNDSALVPCPAPPRLSPTPPSPGLSTPTEASGPAPLDCGGALTVEAARFVQLLRELTVPSEVVADAVLLLSKPEATVHSAIVSVLEKVAPSEVEESLFYLNLSDVFALTVLLDWAGVDSDTVFYALRRVGRPGATFLDMIDETLTRLGSSSSKPPLPPSPAQKLPDEDSSGNDEDSSSDNDEDSSSGNDEDSSSGESQVKTHTTATGHKVTLRKTRSNAAGYVRNVWTDHYPSYGCYAMTRYMCETPRPGISRLVSGHSTFNLAVAIVNIGGPDGHEDAAVIKRDSEAKYILCRLREEADRLGVDVYAFLDEFCAPKESAPPQAPALPHARAVAKYLDLLERARENRASLARWAATNRVATAADVRPFPRVDVADVRVAVVHLDSAAANLVGKISPFAGICVPFDEVAELLRLPLPGDLSDPRIAGGVMGDSPFVRVAKHMAPHVLAVNIPDNAFLSIKNWCWLYPDLAALIVHAQFPGPIFSFPDETDSDDDQDGASPGFAGHVLALRGPAHASPSELPVANHVCDVAPRATFVELARVSVSEGELLRLLGMKRSALARDSTERPRLRGLVLNGCRVVPASPTDDLDCLCRLLRHAPELEVLGLCPGSPDEAQATEPFLSFGRLAPTPIRFFEAACNFSRYGPDLVPAFPSLRVLYVALTEESPLAELSRLANVLGVLFSQPHHKKTGRARLDDLYVAYCGKLLHQDRVRELFLGVARNVHVSEGFATPPLPSQACAKACKTCTLMSECAFRPEQLKYA